MPILETPVVAVLDGQNGSSDSLPDFTTEAYKDAYSRINGIVIEGENEAHQNYVSIGELIPEAKDELKRLALMEKKHAKGFMSCGRNLGVTPDMEFAKTFFGPLHDNFQNALAAGNIPTCLLIQGLIIESFAIAAYHIYIPVSDPFARKITEGVVKDEYLHLNYSEVWLKANLESCREELIQANRQNLPLVRKMLDQVAADAAVLHMGKEDLIEDFLVAYQDALTEIGFTTREIAKMAAAALVG